MMRAGVPTRVLKRVGAPSNVLLFRTKFESKTGCRVLYWPRRLWKELR
jgi:hypothetical protein